MGTYLFSLWTLNISDSNCDDEQRFLTVPVYLKKYKSVRSYVVNVPRWKSTHNSRIGNISR